MSESTTPPTANAAGAAESTLPPQEIERKYLPASAPPAAVRAGAGWDIEQGYFDDRLTVELVEASEKESNESAASKAEAFVRLALMGSHGREPLFAAVPIEFARQVALHAGPGAQAGSRLRLRVNLATGEEEGFLTIKGPSSGASRMELETQVSPGFVREALDLGAQKKLAKTRHLFAHDAETWEIDFFKGSLAGLVLGELELKSEAQAISLPDWMGREVTEDARFSNASLAKLASAGKGLGSLGLSEAEIAAGAASDGARAKKRAFGA